MFFGLRFTEEQSHNPYPPTARRSPPSAGFFVLS